MNNIYGYIRVSTSQKQKTDRQEDALLKYVKEENLFIDKQTGTNFDRPNYKILKKIAREGDVIYIKSLDRMGRSKTQTKEELEYFKSKNIKIKILDIPTTMQDFPKEQAWIGEMVNNILLEVFTTIAQNEIETTKSRQAEGYESARLRGKKFGRPQAQKPKTWDKYYRLYNNKEITSTEFMHLVNLKKTTFYKFLNEGKGTK